MFLAIPEFFSKNELSDIRVGSYSRTDLEFQNSNGTAALLLSEYRLEGEGSPCVVDMIVIDNQMFASASDFLRISSGQWRSSSGQVALSLVELMPPELDNFRLVSESMSGQIIVADGHFYAI